jgi:hypothetical protein
MAGRFSLRVEGPSPRPRGEPAKVQSAYRERAEARSGVDCSDPTPAAKNVAAEAMQRDAGARGPNEQTTSR